MTDNYAMPASSLKDENIDPQGVLDFIDKLKEKNILLHSFIMARNGNIVCRLNAYPYSSDYRHVINSCTKTFNSLAVGIVYDQGLISLDDKVSDYIKNPNAEKNGLKDLTIRHLLTMSVGHDHEPPLDTDKPWAERLFDKPLTYPSGSLYFYNNLASHTLSTIVKIVSGKTSEELLKERFFDKCGIRDYYWIKDPYGIPFGAAGIFIKGEDMLKMGQLFLNKGELNGIRVVYEEYIELATAKQMETAPAYNPLKTESIQGYGFQLWHSTHNAYRASGLFGQVCLVIPDKNVTAVFNSSTSGSQPLLDTFFDTIYPAIDREGQHPANIEEIIKEKMKILDTEPVSGNAIGFYEEQISGKKLKKDDSDDYLILDFKDDSCLLTFTKGKEFKVLLGHNRFKESKTDFDDYYRSINFYKICPKPENVEGPLTYGSYAWISNSHLKIRILTKDDAPYVNLDLYFDDKSVDVSLQIDYIVENSDYKRKYKYRMC